MIGNSNDETIFPDKRYTADTQASKIRKAFANVSSANIKFSKTQLSKTLQSGGFFGRLLKSLLKTRLSLIGNVLKLLTKRVLTPLGL